MLNTAFTDSSHAKPISSKRDQMYNFLVEGISLSKTDLTNTFAGTSLGYRGTLFFQQKRVMETNRKEVNGNSVSWDEAFEL